MNKLELGHWIRERVRYITKDGKFDGVIIEAHDWYFLMDELGIEIVGNPASRTKSEDDREEASE